MRLIVVLLFAILSVSAFANANHNPGNLKNEQQAYVQGEIDSVTGNISNISPCNSEACEQAYLSGAVHAATLKALSAVFV
jgi:hypothetical protein